MDDPLSSNPLPADAEQTPAAPMPSENGGANPLPQEAEHSPAPTTPTESESNPLPADAEHAPAAPMPSESAGANPLPAPEPKAKPANDMLVPAIGYIPGVLPQIAAIIGIIGKNQKARFHGAQALVYWLVVGLLYVPVLILTGILGVIGGGIAATALFVLYLGGIIIALPIYMAYKTLKGRDVVLPVIGRFLAGKVGYTPE